MEEENQVFGKNAEAFDNNENLESEDFNFYHQNKEEAKNNIDSSAKDLTDFIDSLIQDIPDPSEEEVNAGIVKILEKTHPAETQTETGKTNKKKKVTFKVLFIAALLSIISFSCLYVVGSSHNISIENGFVAFAKDTIQIVFFGETEKEYITVDALLTDLELHGYGDILFPQEFVTNSDEYKASIPKYVYGNVKQSFFDVVSNTALLSVTIHNCKKTSETIGYTGVINAKTIVVKDAYVYVFEFKDGTSIEYISDEYNYLINSNLPYFDMIKIAESIK